MACNSCSCSITVPNPLEVGLSTVTLVGPAAGRLIIVAESGGERDGIGIGWFIVIECLRIAKGCRVRRETRWIARDTRKIFPSRWPRNALPQSCGGDRYIIRYASYSTELPHRVTPVPTSRRKSGCTPL